MNSQAPPAGPVADEADVIVVGAGPAGSSTAFHLARAGLDVLLLEKASFPRDKVCGDGLTPRAVKQLTGMGISLGEQDGWLRNKGLRIIGAGARLELDWPELSCWPGFGLVRTRRGFDETVARAAQRAGARLLEGMTVTGPVLDERTGRITGVTARPTAPAARDGGQGGTERAGAGGPGAAAAPAGEQDPERIFRGRLVVAADGNSSRLALAMGLPKRDDRPLGVAVRTYYTSPRHDDDYLESWLELWDNDRLLPGYGWIFGVGDGTSNVGLGLLNTSAAFGNIDYRALLRRWLAGMPREWGLGEENRTEPVRGAALPMGFNRTPHYVRGLLLAGDSGGMVNPFNGEGIAYAMETGETAARVIADALAGGSDARAEQLMHTYPQLLKDAYGGYYTLGRKFVGSIGHPWVMRTATRLGMPRPVLMRFTMKLLANLTEPRGGDAADRIINALSKIAPAA
ncbi:MAG: FAD-dependent oxidoreductase [Nocardiopsaceae bacterium]|nr:FAD-dependent oxidoreductase [Nocardiopsaceae bacterium]